MFVEQKGFDVATTFGSDDFVWAIGLQTRQSKGHLMNNMCKNPFKYLCGNTGYQITMQYDDSLLMYLQLNINDGNLLVKTLFNWSNGD